MASKAQVTILIGAQWGDEGKGKWIDILAEKADLVVRYQGGNNAGHTLYIEGEKVVLHQIPSGVFHAGQTSALAAGVVINPVQLVGEIEKLSSRLTLSPERLWLSGRAHVITPWHIMRDVQREAQASGRIGTTKRGIGPTYADKAARVGLRLAHYVDAGQRRNWITQMLNQSPEFAAHYAASQPQWEEFEASAERLAHFVCDAEANIRKAMQQSQRILLEGAQGTLLDLDHGTYPYVTSSGTGAGGACQSIGFAPRLVSQVMGIAKGYVTRVGDGPFPTEFNDAVAAQIAQRGQEFGATTGRPRRIGWLDAVALRYVVDVNGIDTLVLNKLDILTGLDEIKIAVAYEHPRLGRLDSMPFDTDVLAACKPVYQSFPGWKEAIPVTGKIADMPAAARAYVKAVEQHAGVPISMVGTGPKRHEALY